MESCHLERPDQATVLRWHPMKPLLVLGWESGEVLLLSHPSGEQNPLPTTHAAPITLLEWSSSGSRLVTGDQVRAAVGPTHCQHRTFLWDGKQEKDKE